MTKPTKRKRAESEDAGERVVSEAMLRRAALAYAAVANLDPSDPRWRRCWCALRLTATGMVAAVASAQNAPSGPFPAPFRPPPRGLSAPPRALSCQGTRQGPRGRAGWA